jgi:hypothetical protein
MHQLLDVCCHSNQNLHYEANITPYHTYSYVFNVVFPGQNLQE